MLLLTTTSDKLRLVTSSTADIHVHASYADYSSGSYTLLSAITAITTATTTDIVAVPGASTQRNVKNLVIRNKHASTSNDVTVQFYNGTAYELFKCTLAAGEELIYSDGAGFRVFDATGAVKTAVTPDNTGWVAYTPTITNSGGGAFTVASASGASKQIGKTVFVRISLTITTNGTAVGYYDLSLPVTAASANQILAGREVGVTGNMVAGAIGSFNTYGAVRVTKYDGNFIGGNGYVVVIQGTYEAA